MGSILHSGDAVKWAKEYEGPLFHALLCDAPYEMGFMGKEWDRSGVAFDPDTWAAFARVLHPGAFLFVMAGTINDDLISVAMRQAGLRKFHKMMGWAYGSGFPKASRIDYTVDSEWIAAFVDIPETFAGHRYGLQALKPAIETILIFQKPYDGKPIDNITATGAGCLNIDGGRIGIDEDLPSYTPSKSGLGKHGIYGVSTREQGANSPTRYDSSGRWPSNFLLLDSEAARALDEQSGELSSPGPYKRSKTDSDSIRIYGNGKGVPWSNGATNYGDSGGASRFFFRVEDQIDQADPVLYAAKASRRERDGGLDFLPLIQRETQGRDEVRKIDRKDGRGAVEVNAKIQPARNPHPTVKPLSLCKYLATLLLPPIEYAPRRIFVPFAGVGSEMIGADMAGWEEIEGVEITEEYLPIAEARLSYWQGKSPTRKKIPTQAEAIPITASQLELM